MAIVVGDAAVLCDAAEAAEQVDFGDVEGSDSRDGGFAVRFLEWNER